MHKNVCHSERREETKKTDPSTSLPLRSGRQCDLMLCVILSRRRRILKRTVEDACHYKALFVERFFGRSSLRMIEILRTKERMPKMLVILSRRRRILMKPITGYFILGFDTIAANSPNKIAAVIPPAVAVSPPIKAPTSPYSATASSTPLANE